MTVWIKMFWALDGTVTACHSWRCHVEDCSIVEHQPQRKISLQQLNTDANRRRRHQCIVVKDRSVTLVWPHVVDLFHRSGLVCHCCLCRAGRSIGCSDDLDDASSCAREDGRESDQHDTRMLGVLACLQKAWQRDRRQNSDGVLWDSTPGQDRCALRPRSSWEMADD